MHKLVVVLAWSPESMASIGSLFEQTAQNSHWHSSPLSHSPSSGAVSVQNQHHHTFPQCLLRPEPRLWESHDVSFWELGLPFRTLLSREWSVC